MKTVPVGLLLVIVGFTVFQEEEETETEEQPLGL